MLSDKCFRRRRHPATSRRRKYPTSVFTPAVMLADYPTSVFTAAVMLADYPTSVFTAAVISARAFFASAKYMLVLGLA